MQYPCPRCGAQQMFWVEDINSSGRAQELLWCLVCSLEGKPDELNAKAKAISERVRRNSSTAHHDETIGKS